MSKLSNGEREARRMKKLAAKKNLTKKQKAKLDEYNTRQADLDKFNSSKLTKEQKGALDSFHGTGSTDHYDYDMGDYEKSYK